MPGGDTRTFVEPAHYEGALRRAQIEAVIASRGEFNGPLTGAELHYLPLFRCEEESARTAYLHLAPSLAFVTFPAYPTSLPVWRLREVRKALIQADPNATNLSEIAHRCKIVDGPSPKAALMTSRGVLVSQNRNGFTGP